MGGRYEGSVKQFVAEHADATLDELVELSAAGDKKFKREQLRRAQWTLSYEAKHGGDPRKKAGKRKSKTSAPRRARARANGHEPTSNGEASSATTPKLQALRLLILEVGFDAARAAMAEFERARDSLRPIDRDRGRHD